jgi:hypothetical protein
LSATVATPAIVSLVFGDGFAEIELFPTFRPTSLTLPEAVPPLAFSAAWAWAETVVAVTRPPRADKLAVDESAVSE